LAKSISSNFFLISSPYINWYPFVDVKHLLTLTSSSGPASKHPFGGPAWRRCLVLSILASETVIAQTNLSLWGVGLMVYEQCENFWVQFRK